MGWIKERIKSESKKHERLGLEMWTRLAEAKIEASIYDRIEKWNKSKKYGDLNMQVSSDMLNDLKCAITQNLNNTTEDKNANT